MKRLVTVLLVLLVVGAAAGAYYLRRGGSPPDIQTAPVTLGDIVETVGATGTLEAVTTVQVGTQVSGTIKELYADFNSIVRRGQLLARLDPSLFETQVEQARANLVRAQAEVERLKVALDDARQRLKRATELRARNLIPQTELEAAEVAARAAEAQLRSAQAQLTQAEASLNQAQVNLQHTVITSPIDGIVVSRNVDVGQTVAAGFQAPTLFVLAADLTKMRVNASIDEADVGRIRPGQRVRFRVDAYPTEDFSGTVVQVRLQPTVVQNVVTYAAVIDVPNPELKLKPGMTANVTIEVARREHVVRIPNTALRFRPTTEIFAALGQEPPPEGRGGVRVAAAPPARPGPTGAPEARGPEGPRADQRPAPDTPARPGAGSPPPFVREPGAWRGRGAAAGAGAAMDPERRRRFLERLEALPPEARARALASARGEAGGPAAGLERRASPEAPPTPRRPQAPATTIDALFGPLPPVETTGRVWRFVGGRLVPVAVRLGISDGTFTELLAGDIEPGMELVTSVTVGQPSSRGVGGGRSPLLPGGPRPGGGPPGVRNPAPARGR
jgi:HlyD family secretion protein